MDIENTTTIHNPHQHSNLKETIEGKCLQVTEESRWDYNIFMVWERVVVEVDNMYHTLVNCKHIQHNPTRLTITTPSLTLYSWDRITLTDIAIPQNRDSIILYFEYVGRESGKVENNFFNYKYGTYERSN